MLFSDKVKMTNTRSGTLPEEQAKAEQAKVTATNAKIAEMTQMKSKGINAKLKISIFLRKLKMGLTDYRHLKDKVGEELERDAMVIVIQSNWPKLEDTANELEESMTLLSDAISKATALELREDPKPLIEN